MAAEFDESPTLAMKALKDFKKDYPESWQISLCLQRLAELQIAQGKVDDAEKTYAELGEAKVADDIKQNAEFLAAKLSMQTGKLTLAATRFKALVEKLPKTNPIAISSRSSPRRSACARTNKSTRPTSCCGKCSRKPRTPTSRPWPITPWARTFTTRKSTRRRAGSFFGSTWSITKTRLEHAKSLYYLWKSFSELGEAERAQECLEALIEQPVRRRGLSGKAKAETKK